MKKGKILYLLCALSLLVLGGCQEQKEETQSTVGDGTSLSGYSIEESDQPLTICVDEKNKAMVQQLTDAWEAVYPGQEAELIVIPQDEAGAEAKLTELRTEIMSGHGPDVFLLQSQNPFLATPEPVLFTDPQKMMYRDTFLPLNTYLEHAQYMKVEDLNQTVLEAGRIGEEQYLLPIQFEYITCAFRTDELKAETGIPASWKELTASEDLAVVSAVGSKLFVQFPEIFGELADYEKGQLLFSEDELSARTEEAVACRERSWKMQSNAKDMMGLVGLSVISLAEERGREHTIFALPNAEGGITANVVLYAGINSNTEQPQKAFSILDLLFREEIMDGQGFEKDGVYMGSGIHFWEGISVHTSAMNVALKDLSKEDKEAISEINQKLSTVRFYSELDAELIELFSRYAAAADEAEKKNLVAQTYQAMQMELSE